MLLSTKNFKLKRLKKSFKLKYIRLFKVLELYKKLVYHLDLLST